MKLEVIATSPSPLSQAMIPGMLTSMLPRSPLAHALSLLWRTMTMTPTMPRSATSSSQARCRWLAVHRLLQIPSTWRPNILMALLMSWMVSMPRSTSPGNNLHKGETAGKRTKNQWLHWRLRYSLLCIYGKRARLLGWIFTASAQFWFTACHKMCSDIDTSDNSSWRFFSLYQDMTHTT